MSLYINQINEALREDQDINREVVRRMKKNYQDNTEKMLESTNLSNSAIGLIQSYIDKFQQAIYLLNNALRIANITGTIKYENQTSPAVTEVVKTWNALCGLLRNLLFSKLSKGQQAPIIAQIKRVLPTMPLLIANYEDINLQHAGNPRYTADSRNLDFLIELQRNIESANFMPLGMPLYSEKIGEIRTQEHIAELARRRALAAAQAASPQASPQASPPGSPQAMARSKETRSG